MGCVVTANKINPKECPPYLNDFFTFQRVVKIKSERTLESYYIDLRLYLRYLKLTKGGIDPNTPMNKITISDVPLELVKSSSKLDILSYLNYVASERNNTAKTRHRKLASLKVFYKCLYRDLGLIPSDPTKDVDYPKMHEHLPKFLTLDDSIKLLENMNTDDPYYYRDYCIITLFINCGMRLSELVGLNIQDVNLDERSMRLLGKGNKERIIHINDACASAIVQYINERTPSPFEPNALFLSKRGTRITNRRVQQIVDNALKDSHLDNQGYSTHKLRHTAATLMYQHGNVDTLVLKEILGHKSISTTEIYTHISNESIKESMDNSPLANIKNNKKPSKRQK
ncbi:MAG: tyrosine-type recombinase/integrase [Oscillospiraceae bacterium]|nr:tyrosine-type recombinase/integrase [Oscillospiraceae bacterium]